MSTGQGITCSQCDAFVAIGENSEPFHITVFPKRFSISDLKTGRLLIVHKCR